MNQSDKFVQRIQKKPFAVNIYSNSQCDVIGKFNNSNSKNERVAHLDATGGLVRHPFQKIESQVKQIFYYACVMNCKIKSDTIGRLIPIFELISDCQEAAFLGEWVFGIKLHFKSRFLDIKTPFHRIVVDKSYALIHAVLEGFNNMSVTEYLDMSYRIVCGATSMETDIFNHSITKLHLCYTHSSKVFSKNILKSFDLKKHTENTKFLLKVLQVIAKNKNYEEIKRVIFNLATLFVSEFHGKDIEHSYKELERYVEEQSEQFDDKMNVTDEVQEEVEETDDGKIKNFKLPDNVCQEPILS